MIYAYPKEIEPFVREWSAKMRDPELAIKVNEEFGTSFTAKSMKAYRGNHGIRNYQKQLSSEEYWKYQTKYPQGMYEYIRDNSWGVSSKEMAERVEKLFGYHFTPTGMKQFRQRAGIKSGVTGWYQKGHAPGTKGKTIEEICKGDPEKLAHVRATWFEKGHRPVNELPLGSIRKDPDGYLIRKKSMEGGQWDRWEFVHRAVWEEAHGPIPKGMIIKFKDNNKENCSLDNLMLVSQAVNCTMSKLGLHSKDPDLTEAGAALAELKITMNKKKQQLKKT